MTASTAIAAIMPAMYQPSWPGAANGSEAYP
jgi:hypothetical protein